MDIKNFKSTRAGKIVKTDRDYSAFIPHSLPPDIKYSSGLINLLAEANRHIGNRSQSAISTQKLRGVVSKISHLFNWLIRANFGHLTVFLVFSFHVLT